jgi:hypothetical protein
MRLTEEAVRARVAILNQKSHNEYRLTNWLGNWILTCDGYGYVAYGSRGDLRAVYNCINAIIAYQCCEIWDRKTGEQLRNANTGEPLKEANG